MKKKLIAAAVMAALTVSTASVLAAAPTSPVTPTLSIVTKMVAEIILLTVSV
jgi:hypothetical protein